MISLSLCGIRLWAESAPIILKHPVDVTAAYGDTVTLRVEAIGPDLGYRWEKLPGKGAFLHQTVGTRETLRFDSLAPEHAGKYRVVVTSPGYGSATSREFTIAFAAGQGTDRIRVVKQPTPVRAGRPVGRGVVMDGRFYYPGYDPEGGVELWVTDGTAPGTRRVKDIQPGSGSGLVLPKGAKDGLGVLQSKLYFVADDGEHGRALWVSDGTTSGTQLLQAEFLFVKPASSGWWDQHQGLGDLYAASETIPQRFDSAQDLQAEGFVASDGVLYFQTSSSGVQALGRTDGTAAGTGNLLPQRPQSQEHYPFLGIQAITRRTGSGVFFVATTPEEGRELWVTDGTLLGTHLVSNIKPGGADGIVAARLTPSQGRVFFMAGNSATGQEPWVSDGTKAGTGPLADIHPGTASSLAFEFTVVGDEVFFSAQSPTGYGLWRTDGTVAGTRLVREFEGGVSRLLAAGPAVRPDRLYCMARDAEAGFELWRSDGTPQGTARVADLVPGPQPSSPLPLAADGASVYFLNESPDTARSLRVSNGSEAGTLRLTPPLPLVEHALLRAGDDTYFAGYKTDGGRELVIHRTGGSAATTVELARLPFAADAKLQWADLGGRKLLNTAARTTADFRVGELIVTDGTVAGTAFVNLPALPGSFGSLTPFQDGLLFTAMLDDDTAGLFRSEGLQTRLLLPYPANTAEGIGVAGDRRAIVVPRSSSWQQAGVILTDGTPDGTQALPLAADPSRPSNIAALGDTFILSAGVDGFDELDVDPFDGVEPSYFIRNPELFRISPTGTASLLKEIWPGDISGGNPYFLTRLGEHVYFFANTPGYDLPVLPAGFFPTPAGLWKTDGTSAGTHFVEWVAPSSSGWWYGPRPGAFRPGIFGSRFYFGGQSPAVPLGDELWMSSGSALGTVHVKDVYPGQHFAEQEAPFFDFLTVLEGSASEPAEFVPVGNMLLFAATSPLGRELWKTDGTASGTVMVKDLSTGDEESFAPIEDVLSSGLFGGGDGTYPASAPARNVTNPTNLVAVAGKLYFVARDNEGTKLFRSDGTAAGTAPIESLRSGLTRPRELTAANDRLYYVRGPLALRPQLWEYDPATSEHRAVTALAGGLASPAQLTVADGRLYFVGDDGEGQQLMVYERVPLVKEHPASQTLLAGSSAVLGVTTTASELDYTWRRGLGLALPVGSTPTLTVPAANITLLPYSVRVTKLGTGAQNSHLAFLKVLDPTTSQNIQQFPDSWWTIEPPAPAPEAVAVPGTLDPTWGSSNMVNGSITRIIVLPDGKALVGGTFSEIAGQSAQSLARLNHDGTLDTAFNAGAGPAGGVADMAVSLDGKILIVGNFLTVDGYQRERVARLHADGSVDLDFSAGLGLSGIPSVLTVLPAAGGKLYVGGVFEGWSGHPTVSLVRLNLDGTVDTTFTVSNQPNVGGPFRVAALAYYPSEVDPQWLIVGGGTYFVEPGNGFTNQRRHVARLDATTGAWDPAFNLAPIPNPPASVDGSVSRIAVLPDGKLLVGGIQGGGHTAFDGMLRLNANGTLDTTFKSGPTEGAFGPSLAAGPFLPFEVLASGRIVAGGRFTKVQMSIRPNIVQLLPDGLRDPSFVPAGGPNNEVNALAVQPDGGILIAGTFTAVDGTPRRGLARLHGNPSPPLLLASTTTPDGELAGGLQATLEVKVIGNPPPQVTWYRGDTEVGTGAVLTLSKADPANQGEYYALVANGSGVIATEPVTLAFNTGPPVITDPPQDAVACFLATAVFRVSATGAVPLSYQWKRNGEDMPGEAGPVLRVPVNRLDAGKDSYTVTVSNPLAAVESAPARIVLSQQGVLDTCFYEYTLPIGINDSFIECQPPTTFDFPSYEAVESIAWQPSGHVVIGGGAFTHGSQWSPRTPPFLMRFTEWGLRAYPGQERPDAAVHVVAAAPDSTVYLAGDFKNIVDEAGAPLHAQRWVAKYDASLRFVPGFAPTLLPETAQVTALLVQPDGKLLMAGTFSNVNGQASLGIARLLPDGQSDPAFRSGIVFMNYAKPLALALQADGKILLGGQGAYYGAGAPPVGEYRNQLCRLNPDGSWDPSFETAGGAANAGYVENVHSIVVQPDQRILIAGFLARWGNVPRSQLARLHPDGGLDLSFDAGTGPEGNVNALGLLPDGRVYAAGFFQKFNGLTAANLVRLNADGSMDEGYRAPRMNGVRALAMLPDGSAIVGGSFRSGPILPPVGDPTETTREWRHPGTGSIHNLRTITWESQCPGHGPEIGQTPWLGNFCGMSVTALNGVMRLRGAEFALEAPRIAAQPEGTVTLTENAVHTLFVGVQANLPEGAALAYQWSKDGVDIPGATRALLRLDPVTRAKAGTYSVRVSSELGMLVSDSAVVQVAPAATPGGRVALLPAQKRFEWRFDPAPGRQFTPADAEGLRLEASDDLRRWVLVPGGVLIENGALVFREDQAEFKAKRFYRLASVASLPPPSAELDPSAQVPLESVPANLRALAEQHLQSFIGEPRSRTAEERNWENAAFAPEARHIFDPGYRQGTEPAFVELKVVSAANPADERGYLLLSLTEEDFPVLEFATRGPTKTDQLLRRLGQGVVQRFMRFTPAYVVAEDAAGRYLASLGTMPQRVVGDLPDEGAFRTAHFDSEVRTRTVPARTQANLVPFTSYDALREEFSANSLRLELRAQRKREAAARWALARGAYQPRIELRPGETITLLPEELLTSARADSDDDDEPVVSVELLRGGGARLTGVQVGSQLLRLRLADGRVQHHPVVVSARARAAVRLHGDNCGYVKEQNWYAGSSSFDAQPQYHQMHRPQWCQAVGCGPTALAMLFAWWDWNGVPSAFYRLKSGGGSPGSFRFDFASLAGVDAPQVIGTAEEPLMENVYNDLHGLCNVMCSPFGDGGATYPDQMESAFYEYLARVAFPPLLPPMNEFGDNFVGVTADASWVPPGGMTDWEGGGRYVAKGIKEGRPGITGIGLCLCDPPHYTLAFGYKRLDAIVGCSDPETVETRRFFLMNMGHGPGTPPEWHVAEDVWFGLTANLWQKKLPHYQLPSDPGAFLGAAFSLGPKYEVSRPAAAMTPLAQRLVLLEGDNHGTTPTPFTRMTSVNGGANFSAPLVPGIGQGVFRSGPAVVISADGQRLHAFGLGTDKRLWRASSINGGQSWPNAWGAFGPDRVYAAAPGAATSADGALIHVAAMGTDDACYVFTSRDGGQTWPVSAVALGGTFKSAPAVTTSFYGDAVHVFGLGTDQRFWHAYSFNSGTNWAGWWPVGFGAFNSAPAAVMSPDGGTIRLFGRGLDHGFYQAVSTDDSVTWSNWTAIVPGAVFSSGPAATLEADGQRLRLFGRGWPPTVPEGTIPDPTKPRLWQAFSPDGGANWPGGFTEIVPAVE